jgi:uncharacterized membrane protein YgcG
MSGTKSTEAQISAFTVHNNRHPVASTLIPCLVPNPLPLQIAHLMDNGSLRIEGIMPGGAVNTWSLPIDIYCFGSSPAVAPVLQHALIRTGLGLRLNVMSLEQAAAAMAGGGGAGGRGGAGSSSSGGRGAGGRAAAALTGMSYLTPAQLDNSLNRLFEGDGEG